MTDTLTRREWKREADKVELDPRVIKRLDGYGWPGRLFQDDLRIKPEAIDQTITRGKKDAS